LQANGKHKEESNNRGKANGSAVCFCPGRRIYIIVIESNGAKNEEDQEYPGKKEDCNFN
jgi:hypothetical protein